MTMTWPDLGYTLFMVSQYYTNPNSNYIVTVIQILRYMYNRLYYRLTYTKSQPEFVSYINAN